MWSNDFTQKGRELVMGGTVMGLSTKQIYQFYYDASVNRVSAFSILRNMLIESLSPHRKRVYECVYDAGAKGITSRQIADKLKGSQNGVDNALLELYKFDLLIRTEMKDEHGLYHVYRTGR